MRLIALLALLAEPAYGLTLTDAVHRVWQGAAVAAQVEVAAVAAHDVARHYLPNEPQLQLARGDDGASAGIGVSLAVGLPGKAKALKAADAARSEQQQAEVIAKRHELARLTVQAYVDCATATEAAAQQGRAVQDQEDLLVALKRLYGAGRVTQAETIGAELQLRQAESDLTTSRDKVAVACQKLEELVGLPAARSPSVYALPRDVDAALLAELGPLTADELRSHSLARVSEAQSAAATWAQLPDVTLSATRNHYLLPTASPAGKSWTTSLAASVTLPLLYRSYEANEARRSRAQAALDQSNAALNLLQAKADIADAARDYQRSRARLTALAAKDLPLGEALFESTFAAYRTGKVGYAELVMARRTLADLKAQEVQLKAAIINAHLRCLGRCQESAAPSGATQSRNRPRPATQPEPLVRASFQP